MQVHPVEDSGHQLAKVESRRHSGASAEPARDADRQRPEDIVAHFRLDATPMFARIEVAHLAADGDQPVEVERLKPELDVPGIVEAWILRELDVQPLGERRQTLHSL